MRFRRPKPPSEGLAWRKHGGMERGGAGEGRDITMWFAEACRNVKGLGEVGQSENSARYRTWEREYVEQAMPRPIGEKAPLRRLRIERRDWAVSTILVQVVEGGMTGAVGRMGGWRLCRVKWE